MQDKPSLEELTRKRDRCKDLLDKAQETLNKRMLADSPVKRGDIVQDEETIFRVLSVSVKTYYGKDGTLQDRLMIEFQKKQIIGQQTSWQKANINATDLTKRVLSGKARVVRHAQVT